MLPLRSRISRFLASAPVEASMIGWRWVLADRILRRMGIKEVWLKPKGLRHRVACRIASSDKYEYIQSLGRGRTPLNLPIRPKIIVDAGANVGYSVLRFQQQFPGAVIIALEPEHSNIAQFKKNCAAYSNIILEEKALWSASTRLRISTFDADHNGYRVEEDTDGDIEAICVKDIINQHHLPRIDLLKVDIEGSEKIIFSHSDAKNWLQFVNMVLIETHDRFMPGCSEAVGKALENMFDCRGYIDEYSFYVRKPG